MALGDIVRLQSDERLDLPDLNAITTLLQDTFERVIAGSIGEGEGVLTAPSMTAAADAAQSWVDVGECLFYHWYPDGADGKLPTAQVLRHDPTLSSQVSRIYITGAQDLETFLWARRIELDTDVDNRREWDTGIGDEVLIAPPVETRTSERIEFSFSTGVGTPGPASDGWFRFAYVPAAGWAVYGAGLKKVPTAWYFISPFDYESWDWTDTTKRLAALILNIGGASSRVGIAQYLEMIVLAINQIRDGTSSVDPSLITAPDRDMQELHDDLAAVETASTTNTNTLSDLDARLAGRYNVGVGTMHYDSGLAAPKFYWNTYVTAGVMNSFVRNGAGDYTMVVNGEVDLIATPSYNYVSGSPAVPVLPPHAVYTKSRSYSSATKRTTFDVLIFDRNGGAYDVSFNVLFVGTPQSML